MKKNSSVVDEFIVCHLRKCVSLDEANVLLQKTCGVVEFCTSQQDFHELLQETCLNDSDEDRSEYGDFQTNEDLSDAVVEHLAQKGIAPRVIVEPTCGKGNFILSSLRGFRNIRFVLGIEIYKPYVQQTKYRILHYFLSHPEQTDKPEIHILQENIFSFDFSRWISKITTNQLLIIGNPPWVTNSALGAMVSENLPQKRNIKNLSGIEAITGKGNFDIAESILLQLIVQFGHMKGYMAFLIKNSVIKTLIFDQYKKQLPIGEMKKYAIDSKKEFGVSVEASLFSCRLNALPEMQCEEYDFYSSEFRKSFGWNKAHFVSDKMKAEAVAVLDGVSPLEWRQGVKHDCSKVMDLLRLGNGLFRNKLGDVFTLEEDRVFDLLKSSDLKGKVATYSGRCTIITQDYVGQNTDFLSAYPMTRKYLQEKQMFFRNRKSIVYKNKPEFSIFGIGSYSFSDYKVAISGLYKTYHFTYVPPIEGKPVMTDDTCYFLGFDEQTPAVFTWIILNAPITRDFLFSTTFPDDKRMITKEVLMRIDLHALANLLSVDYIIHHIEQFNMQFGTQISVGDWDIYRNRLKRKQNKQLTIF